MLKTVFDSLEARVYTEDFRVYGMMHLPQSQHQDTVRLLNREDKVFLRVTKGIVYEKGFVHPPSLSEYKASISFIAIPTKRVLWVLGGRSSQPDITKLSGEARPVYLLYDDYFLQGLLHLPPGVQLSSFLDNAVNDKAFHTLYDVSLGPVVKGQELLKTQTTEYFEFINVNLHNVGGIFDVATDNL